MTMMKLLRVYTDENAYFGDRKVFELIAEDLKRLLFRQWSERRSGGRQHRRRMSG